MVGIRRVFISLFLCVLPLCVVAQGVADGFIGRQLSQLSARSERLSKTLGGAQQEYQQQPSDSLSKVIYELERQLSAIENAIARLAAQQQIEEEEVVVEQPAPIVEPAEKEIIPEEPTPEEEIVEEQPEPEPQTEPQPEAQEIQEAQEPQNTIVASEELKSLFSTTSRRYALIEGEIAGLIEEYGKVYNTILASLKGYEDATSLKVLNAHHKEYLAAVERSGRIADSIALRSDLMLTSKTNSYLGFADSLGIDTLRTNYNALAEQTEATMSEKLAGKCTDLDLAMYPHRLRNTIRLEALLAQGLAPEIADSLMARAESFDTTFTLFTPYGTPKRSNVEFKGVTINKKAKEKAVSSLPTIKIPSEGELYSITVANYASLPPSTKVFRGATPLLRERREDGRTYIYIGLYPTARSAQDDIALLRQTGFKQPTLVMWRDGIRRDDFVDRHSTPTTPKAAMWRVEISGATTVLPSEVLGAIRDKAPRKEISKFNAADGTTLYTVGIFTKENEAKAVANAIRQTTDSLSVEVVQVGKK